MNERREYGFPGCTPRQKINHRRWCRDNGYHPYNEYRRMADESIAARKELMPQRGAANNATQAAASKRPAWMSKDDWKLYLEYLRRSPSLGVPNPTPEWWVENRSVRRTKTRFPLLTAAQNKKFLRVNRTRRYKNRAELTPEQYLEWLSAPKYSNGRRIKPKKPKAPNGGKVFTRPIEDIIMKILMATKQARSQDERSRTRQTDSVQAQEHGNHPPRTGPDDRTVVSDAPSGRIGQQPVPERHSDPHPEGA